MSVLQSRDPFSGDCETRAATTGERGMLPSLAEPRPVLRGLRRGIAEIDEVLRPHACRAETRSQGIATPLGGS